jgi:Luciferase
VNDEILAAGMASSHHVLPGTGRVSLYLRHPKGVHKAIGLLKRSYEIARQQRERRGAIFLFLSPIRSTKYAWFIGH